ncbi:hypothetical protein STAQ_34990 [Allostella sp. ATCC 35155]|nr:hypothetical protein STAQ_34990 [Stella sp. ATCC 35155]
MLRHVPAPLAVTDRNLVPIATSAAWDERLAPAGDPRDWPDDVVAGLLGAIAAGRDATLPLPSPIDPQQRLLVSVRPYRQGRRRLAALLIEPEGAAVDPAAERAAALGQLLASIVHELNNQLATILAQTQLVRRAVRNRSQQDRLDRSIEAARQSARIVTNLLDLARRRPVRRTPLALPDIARRAVELVRGRIEQAGIALSTDLPDGLPAVAGDATGLGQVVVNLLTNACDALAEVPPPRRLSLTLRHDPDSRMLELRVADNGPGMPPAVLRRIFQPFFTTKPEGKGTGLGLSLCVTQVKELGGGITAANRPEGGAEFLVRLPESLAGEAARLSPAHRPAGGAAILVVDDDGEFARYVQSLLRRDGHAVDLAADGLEALRRIDRRRYDLIVSDIHMPGMDGTELFRRLDTQDRDAAGRVLFVTGDVANPELEQFFLLAGRPVIAKPFDDERFLSVVRQLLPGGGGTG